MNNNGFPNGVMYSNNNNNKDFDNVNGCNNKK